MSYSSHNPSLTRALYRAHSCPFLVPDGRCAGGDYCDFPPGHDRLCCIRCPRVDSCPDSTGICIRLKE
jgi:hypothetical protein